MVEPITLLLMFFALLVAIAIAYLVIIHKRKSQQGTGPPVRGVATVGESTNEQPPQGPTILEANPAEEEETQLPAEEPLITTKEALPNTSVEIFTQTAENNSSSVTEGSQSAGCELADSQQTLQEVCEREVPPIKRGGVRNKRPRKPTDTSPLSVHFCAKPEIVCWKAERSWFIGVEVPDDLLENPSHLEILQNGQPLSCDDYEETRWPLRYIGGQVVCQWKKGDSSPDFPLTIGQEGYLLFKLSGQNLSTGRLVKSATSGSYLVVAPNAWERDEKVAGPPPVEPEPVAIEGYLAHFFELEKGSGAMAAFLTPEEKHISISPKSSRFELIGERLPDAGENIGPLFSQPPKIHAVVPKAWEEIKTLVLGEEGSGRGKWRTQFSPKPDCVDQDLPSEILAKRGGWFFLRFYDGNDELVESFDFRFLSGLHRVEIPGSFPLPHSDGYEPIRVELIHDPEITINSVENLSNVGIERETGKTILTVPPDPMYDITHWRVSYENGPSVEITILVERVWWALGEEGDEPTRWEDKPLVLSRDDFTATSKRVIWLRLPKARWVDRIYIGFSREKKRSYPVKVTEKTLAVPLREFADAEEVANLLKEHQLRVLINRNGEFEGVVAILPASPPLQQWVGIGRYKTAVARAILEKGSGNIIVNGIAAEDYFKHIPIRARLFLQRLRSMPAVCDLLSHLDAQVEVRGSDPTTMRQARAVGHALARAMMVYEPKLKSLLKQAGFGGAKVLTTAQKERRDKC